MTSLASKRWAGLRRLPLSKVLISRLIRREAQTPGARLFRPGTGQGFIGTSAASCPRQGADSKLGSHCFLGPTWQSALGYWGRGKRKCALSRAGREPRLTSLTGLWTPGAHGAPAGSCSPGKEGVREGSRQTPELGGPSAPGTGCRDQGCSLSRTWREAGAREPAVAWDGKRVCSRPRSCALPCWPRHPLRGPTRLARTFHPGPPPRLSECVVLEEWWRGGVCPLQAGKGFPAFPCSQQGRFWPEATEPRKGRFSERGSTCVGLSGTAFLPGCFPWGVHRPARASTLSSPAPRYSPRALVHEWARQVFCFQSSVSLRSRLNPRPGRDPTHRFAKPLKRSIRMFIKYSIYAVCPRSHRPKIKSAV